MKRIKFIRIFSSGLLASLIPKIFVKKAFASSTFYINQDECICCEACVDEVGCINCDDEDYAFFTEDCGGWVANIDGGYCNLHNCGTPDLMFNAVDVCPVEALVEYG